MWLCTQQPWISLVKFKSQVCILLEYFHCVLWKRNVWIAWFWCLKSEGLKLWQNDYGKDSWRIHHGIYDYWWWDTEFSIRVIDSSIRVYRSKLLFPCVLHNYHAESVAIHLVNSMWSQVGSFLAVDFFFVEKCISLNKLYHMIYTRIWLATIIKMWVILF